MGKEDAAFCYRCSVVSVCLLVTKNGCAQGSMYQMGEGSVLGHLPPCCKVQEIWHAVNVRHVRKLLLTHVMAAMWSTATCLLLTDSVDWYCPGDSIEGALHLFVLFSLLYFTPLNVQVTMNLTFEQAAVGCEKDVLLNVSDTCPRCLGNKAEPGTGKVQCHHCGGTGMVRRAQYSSCFTFC